MVVFEWDETKNQINQKKHGLSFDLAQMVFFDPLALIRPDQGAHGEDRWQIMGKVNNTVIVLVVFVVRDEDSEVYRLISARKVTSHERKRYETI